MRSSGQANLSSLCRFNLVANFVQKFGFKHTMLDQWNHLRELKPNLCQVQPIQCSCGLRPSADQRLAATVGLFSVRPQNEPSSIQSAASGKPQWERINSKRDPFTGQCNQVTPSLSTRGKSWYILLACFLSLTKFLVIVIVIVAAVHQNFTSAILPLALVILIESLEE